MNLGHIALDTRQDNPILLLIAAKIAIFSNLCNAVVSILSPRYNYGNRNAANITNQSINQSIHPSIPPSVRQSISQSEKD